MLTARCSDILGIQPLDNAVPRFPSPVCFRVQRRPAFLNKGQKEQHSWQEKVLIELLSLAILAKIQKSNTRPAARPWRRLLWLRMNATRTRAASRRIAMSGTT